MIPILRSDEKVIQNHTVLCRNLIRNGISEVRTSGFLFNGANVLLSPAEIEFLRILERNLFLTYLLSALPESLEQKIKYFKSKNIEALSHTKRFNRLLYAIFVTHGYERLTMEQRWEFIRSINIDTCPYCNRNYAYSFDKAKGIKPEIDHFFPKSKYPFLALTFYNLIPSCHTCNSSPAKGQKDPVKEKMVSPYLIDHNSFYFTHDVLSVDVLCPLGGNNRVKINIQSKGTNRNINVLRLSELYQKHEDHVLELIVKSQLSYTAEYREYLESYKRLSFSDSEIDRMIMGNYTPLEELHKRPLSKLYRDIGVQLGLIKGL